MGGNSVANERWEDGESQIPKAAGAGKNEGRFPSYETLGLINRKFPVSSGIVYSGISKNKGATSRGIHKFFTNALPGHSLNFLPEFPELSVEWFNLGKFNNFQSLVNFLSKFQYNLIPF